MKIFFSKHVSGPLAFCALLLCSLIFIAGNAAAQDDTITVETNLIRMNVGVADRGGRPVTNLKKEDFTVYEDGVKQDITFFEPTVSPFSVVMLLDMSGSTLTFRQNIAQAASRFIASLGPEDRVAVVEFYDKINLLSDFTTDRQKSLFAVSAANGRGKTQLYKALDFAMDKLQKEGPKRRKAVVVLTDGVDTGAREKDRDTIGKVDDKAIPSAVKPETNDALNHVLDDADRQGVTIFPLALPTGDPKLLADPTPTQVAMFTAARSRLQILADRTGGRLNSINRLEDLGKFYAAVAADLRALYTVAYESNNSNGKKGQWRAIRLETNESDVVVRTRQGYFVK
jgi:Ca-activated chloride channel family protein